MPGPQVAPAIAASIGIRARRPDVPILWGGYFPSLYADAAVNAPYVDYVVRGPGEDTLLELLDALPDAGTPSWQQSAAAPTGLGAITGLTWKRDGAIVHNGARPFAAPDDRPPLPYQRLNGIHEYLRSSFVGTRTAVHQAAIGCRYRCTFCGVVSVYNGATRLSGADRLAAAPTACSSTTTTSSTAKRPRGRCSRC
jgi:radical SAM superfamily enzyme YgiQ (UPF0313 family)